jgi:hypothetical protein
LYAANDAMTNATTNSSVRTMSKVAPVTAECSGGDGNSHADGEARPRIAVRYDDYAILCGSWRAG